MPLDCTPSGDPGPDDHFWNSMQELAQGIFCGFLPQACPGVKPADLNWALHVCVRQDSRKGVTLSTTKGEIGRKYSIQAQRGALEISRASGEEVFLMGLCCLESGWIGTYDFGRWEFAFVLASDADALMPMQAGALFLMKRLGASMDYLNLEGAGNPLWAEVSNYYQHIFGR